MENPSSNTLQNSSKHTDYRTPEILPNEVQLKEVLGVGSFGKVHRAKCRGHDVCPFHNFRIILDLCMIYTKVSSPKNKTRKS
jgi:hypothetical protein